MKFSLIVGIRITHYASWESENTSAYIQVRVKKKVIKEDEMSGAGVVPYVDDSVETGIRTVRKSVSTLVGGDENILNALAVVPILPSLIFKADF